MLGGGLGCVLGGGLGGVLGDGLGSVLGDVLVLIIPFHFRKVDLFPGFGSRNSLIQRSARARG